MFPCHLKVLCGSVQNVLLLFSLRLSHCVTEVQCTFSFIVSFVLWMRETACPLIQIKKQHPVQRLQVVEGLFISHPREECTVLCANYFYIMILHLTQADLMTESTCLRPLCIMKMDRSIGNAWWLTTATWRYLDMQIHNWQFNLTMIITNIRKC